MFLDLLNFISAKPASWIEQHSCTVMALIPFNSHDDGKPAGSSNNRISWIASRTSNRDRPIVGQWEFEDTEPKVLLTHSIFERGHPHITSYEFLKKVNELYPGRKILVFAHSAHGRRCKLIAEKLGMDIALADSHNSPYDKNGNQWWCRGPIRFFFWEALTRVHHLAKGWI